MKNILLKGGPGTGKTIVSRAMAFYLCQKKLLLPDVFKQDIQADYDDIETFINSEAVEFIQVHPSMCYEDIVYGIEIKPSGGLNMAYAEKRIKELCDRANGKAELYCIILDDICRTNSGALLGNLLYAMEYRKQPVDLADGTTMIIPDNVYIILTECNQSYGTGLEYALRRRMDYVRELHSDRNILDTYYGGVLASPIKHIILDVYDSVKTFITGGLPKDPDIQPEDYIPGHGMFMVDRLGTANDILLRIKYKLIYQIFPLIKEMHQNGLITGDLNLFFADNSNKINVGIASAGEIVKVEKIFYSSLLKPSDFSLKGTWDYYVNTIIPGGCQEHRGIMEGIIDAIFLNGIFPYDISFAELLKNTSIVKFEDRARSGDYAAYIVPATDNHKFGYLTSVSTNPRSFYSSNPIKKGRWKPEGKRVIPAYRAYGTGGISVDYMYLNAFRDAGFDVSQNIIHASENSASIYCAVYRLVYAYLVSYATHLMLTLPAHPENRNLYQLIVLEKSYLELLNIEAQKLSGSKNRVRHLCEKIVLLRTLWTPKDDSVTIDRDKFNDLLTGRTRLTVSSYEDLYNYTSGTAMPITIKGVTKMTDLKDYQRIMNDIGVRQMVFQGPPGTSKTFESKRFILKQLNPGSPVLSALLPTQEQISYGLQDYKLTDEDYKDPSSSPKRITGGWDLVQFHPSYGYEDFIRGIEVKPVAGSPTYSSVNRILGKIAEFSKLAEQAAAGGAGDIPKFYLLIDEINRANLATVFGELIYGLEYRDSQVSTPYEVEDRHTGTYTKDIVLGKNLFIIGTMNTADKSIDAIDYAIRRRFLFIDSPADRDVVVKCYQNTMGVTDENSIELLLFDGVSLLFEDEEFFNSDYQKSDVKLGHTYFLRNSKTSYLDIITEHFIFQVIPILREYVKDGIFEASDDLLKNEHSVADIVAETDPKLRLGQICENLKLFIHNFGDRSLSGHTINNEYIGKFIEDLCGRLGY